MRKKNELTSETSKVRKTCVFAPKNSATISVLPFKVMALFCTVAAIF